MKTISLIVAAAAALAILSCGSSSLTPAPAKSEAVAPAPPAPAIPDDVQKAAELALGSETEVLAFGDLSKTGPQQVLAINRLKAPPQGVAPGTLVTRAVIIENDGNTWKQIFLCDEHLKNTKEVNKLIESIVMAQRQKIGAYVKDNPGCDLLTAAEA